MSSPKFKIGDKVFAKIRGYCPWPAKVEGVADLTPGKVKYHVYFYGTNQMAVSKEQEVCLYSQNKHKYGRQKKIKHFNKSLKEAEADQSPDFDLNTLATESQICKKRLVGEALCQMLEVEKKLTIIQEHIRNKLSITNPDPESCIKPLDEFMELELTPLMIKKHPTIISFLSNLKRYHVSIHNDENVRPEEAEQFRLNVSAIQSKASQAYDKVKDLFTFPNDEEFLDFLQDELSKFMKQTEHLTRRDVLLLSTDPSEHL